MELWVNPNETNPMPGNTVISLSNVNDYKYLEIIGRWSVDYAQYFNNGRVPIKPNMTYLLNAFQSPVGTSRLCKLTDVGLIVYVGYNGSTQGNGYCIPCKILAYK